MSDFMNIVAPEDRERAFADLGTLFEKEAARVTSELRLTRKWSPPAEENGAAVDDTAWMLTTGFSVFEAGKPKLLMGYVYDISQQKWAESVQSHHAAETLDAKRRQDEFIVSDVARRLSWHEQAWDRRTSGGLHGGRLSSRMENLLTLLPVVVGCD